MPSGIAMPTAGLKSDGALWFAAWRLISFQIDFCCALDRSSLSLAAAELPARFDMWLAADATDTPDSSNTAATATDADFFIAILLKNRRPCPSNRFVPTMFH